MPIKKEHNLKLQNVIEKLYFEYRENVFHLCLIYLKDVGRAEDAMQDTFLKALRHYSSFRHECSDKTWLLRIAANTCRDYHRTAWLRSAKRECSLSYLLEKASASLQENQMAVLIEVERLPVRFREVIMLRYYQQLSIEEIAQVLQLSQSGVQARLRKARGLLREPLTEVYFCE